MTAVSDLNQCHKCKFTFYGGGESTWCKNMAKPAPDERAGISDHIARKISIMNTDGECGHFMAPPPPPPPQPVIIKNIIVEKVEPKDGWLIYAAKYLGKVVRAFFDNQAYPGL